MRVVGQTKENARAKKRLPHRSHGIRLRMVSHAGMMLVNWLVHPVLYVDEQSHAIFVKNLNFSTTEDALREQFRGCAGLNSCTIAMKKVTLIPSLWNPWLTYASTLQNSKGETLSRGFGFVEFATHEAAKDALKAHQVCGACLSLRSALTASPSALRVGRAHLAAELFKEERRRTEGHERTAECR